MHNIDINFLKDRKLETLSSTTNFKKRTSVSAEEKLPIFIGSGVALALIALSGGALLFLNSQKSAQTQAIQDLENEILRLQGKNQEVQAINQQIDNEKREIGILVSVFDQIKPWSAMLSEIASLTPNNVQIRSLSQSGNRSLTINGYAVSFEQVNDLFLTLKNSSLLTSEETQLQTSSLVDNPSTIIFDRSQLNQDDNNNTANQNRQVSVELPKVVLYTINTSITNESSQKFRNQLINQGALGLASRLNTLERKGALAINNAQPTTQANPGEAQ